MEQVSKATQEAETIEELMCLKEALLSGVLPDDMGPSTGRGDTQMQGKTLVGTLGSSQVSIVPHVAANTAITSTNTLPG